MRGSGSQGTPWKALVFDFDGVIVESVGIKDEAFRRIFAGHPDRIEEIMAYHRSRNAVIRYEKFRHIVTRILGGAYDAETAADLAARYRGFVLERIRVCPFVPGARELLEAWAGRVPMYLASVNPIEDIEELLEARGLRRFFVGLYPYPWRKAEALREIVRRTGGGPRAVAFIGDSPEDGDAAREAGTVFFGRDSGRPFPEGTAVFPDLFAVAEALENLPVTVSAG